MNEMLYCKVKLLTIRYWKIARLISRLIHGYFIAIQNILINFIVTNMASVFTNTSYTAVENEKKDFREWVRLAWQEYCLLFT